jgi:dipeptidyl-peptidase-4
MKIRFLILLVLGSATVFAQDKMLTTENCVFAGRDGLTPQRLTQLNWIKGTDDYYFIDKITGVETLVRGKATEKGEAKKIIDLNELNKALQALNITAAGGEKIFPAISWINPNSFSFVTANTTFTYDCSSKKISSKAISPLTKGSENADVSSVGNTAYTIENNLFVHMTNLTGSADIKVTTESDKNIVCGKSVHREEFGITKGTFWSPDGNHLAFYRMDQTMVTDYPVYDLSKQPAQVTMIKYPMAGGTSHQVTVGVFNCSTSKTVFLKTEGPVDQYLTNIAWSPDNKFVYIAVLNRDQNHLWLNRYNAETGAFDKTLFEETDPKYVHPMHPVQFVPGHPDEFIWQRELCSEANENGLNEIILYNTDGKMLQRLSLPKDVATEKSVKGEHVTDIYGFDPKGTLLYFQGAPINTCDKQIYSGTLNGKVFDMKMLSNEAGTHAAVFSEDKKYYIDTYSSIENPGTQSIHDSKGNQIKVLLTAKNPLADYKKWQVKLFTMSAADMETKLWCRMILPPGFDSTKKYRTFTYLYNGPNVQLVTNSWMGASDFFLYYMAQQGFVVFTMDGRGSDNRGMKFEQATFRHLGTQEIADQERGANFLKSLKFVDADRMAVFGWSFGGFMTTSLMTRKPDLFKCGVAGGPVIDWSYYEVMYTERYMDTPQTNPEGYKEASLLNYAGNLKGKLLQIHGTSDDVVVWQHSLLFQKACVDKNVQCDYYVYPGHLHNVRGKDRVNLYDKVSAYVISNT